MAEQGQQRSLATRPLERVGSEDHEDMGDSPKPIGATSSRPSFREPPSASAPPPAPEDEDTEQLIIVKLLEHAQDRRQPPRRTRAVGELRSKHPRVCHAHMANKCVVAPGGTKLTIVIRAGAFASVAVAASTRSPLMSRSAEAS